MNSANVVAMALGAVMLLAAGVIIGYTWNGEAQVAIAPLIITNDPVNFYGMSDNNSTVIVTKNETFCLLLAKDFTMGYEWSLNLTEGLRVVSDNYVFDNENPIRGCLHVWVIKATERGNQTVSASYRGPWENTTTTGQYILNIVVHDANENIADDAEPSWEPCINYELNHL
jgi:predicted secreted protein